jgi:hypothetical protein
MARPAFAKRERRQRLPSIALATEGSRWTALDKICFRADKWDAQIVRMPKSFLAAVIWFLALLAAITAGLVVFLLTRVPDAPGPVAVSAQDPVLTYFPQPIGFPLEGHPMIAHVAVADLEPSGLPGVLVCDATANRIGWIRQYPRGVFTEQFIGDPVQGPAHVSVGDINGDGLPDLLVACMGQILPNNDRIGKIVVMENLGGGRFRNHVVAENIARVTDVRGADLNGDGRMDLVAGQFGYVQGEIRWMENLGDWRFRNHPLLDRPGTIMTPVADFDSDGKADFAALVSQDSEEVYGQVHLFHNLGNGELQDTVVWKTDNLGFGSSGLTAADINGDGRPDLAFTNGDGFNSAFAAQLPWHGLQWLENLGNHTFSYHRIGDSPGCYSPVCVDLSGHGHGHLDIVTVSAFNNSLDASAVMMTAWLNDGHEHFTPVPLARAPTHMVTVAAGDLDGNGVPVLVTGGFHAYPPYVQLSRVTLWRRR